MMLSSQHREVVITVLAQHLANQPFYAFLDAEVCSLLEPSVQQDYSKAIYDLDWPTSPNAAARAALELMERQSPPGPQPNLLPHYLDRLSAGSFPVLAGIVADLQDELSQPAAPGPGPAGDAYDTYLVLGGQPFLDRRQLRPKLRQLLFEKNGPSVLAVSGPRRSGKTYTTALLEHLSRELQEFELISPVDIGETPSPREIARSLVARMGRSTESLPDLAAESPNSYLIRLAEWVVREAVASNHRWCLVIDGIDENTLLTDIKKFINHLAKFAQEGPGHKYLRLLLLGYREPFPNLWTKSVDRDDLEPPDKIGLVDVEDYFLWLAESIGQQLDRDQVRFPSQAVIDQCPPADPERMTKLCQAVEDQTLTFVRRLRGDAQ
jgi:hypothetical protein